MKNLTPVFWIFGAIVAELTHSHEATWIILAGLFSFLYLISGIPKVTK